MTHAEGLVLEDWSFEFNMSSMMKLEFNSCKNHFSFHWFRKGEHFNHWLHIMSNFKNGWHPNQQDGNSISYSYISYAINKDKHIFDCNDKDDRDSLYNFVIIPKIFAFFEIFQAKFKPGNYHILGKNKLAFFHRCY